MAAPGRIGTTRHRRPTCTTTTNVTEVQAMSFKIRPDELRKAAGQASSAAEQVRGVALRTGAEQIARALPGAAASSAAAALAGDWNAEVEQWAKATGDYGQNLDACATQYLAGDNSIAEEFTAIRLSAFGGLR
ncbi:hypothetical protein [Saccharopolyspora shandongensis]|uniref:hypothetical protein n=1 Tax=Saccharopolyspora shandongensis TaxID=418495 RepID=UPI0033FCBA70